MSERVPSLGPPDDPDAPPTEQERAAAEALRDALDAPTASADVKLLRAFRHAASPNSLASGDNARLIARALTRAPRPRARVVALAAAAVVAVAAGWFAVLVPERPDATPPETASLALARSTQALFGVPFSREDAASARIDRISLARSSDLRDNRFAARGVR